MYKSMQDLSRIHTRTSSYPKMAFFQYNSKKLAGYYLIICAEIPADAGLTDPVSRRKHSYSFLIFA